VKHFGNWSSPRCNHTPARRDVQHPDQLLGRPVLLQHRCLVDAVGPFSGLQTAALVLFELID
jgi:hypothetical protein